MLRSTLKLVISSHMRSFLALAHLLESLRVLQEFPQQDIVVSDCSCIPLRFLFGAAN